MGVTRSMGDYYEGYSLIITIVLITLMVILWLLSGAASENRRITSIVLAPIAQCLLAFSVIEFMYFFPFAASISLVVGILVVVSISTLKRA